MGSMIRGLAWDVGLPLAAYYLLHLAGASDWVALLAGTLAAGVRIVWVAVRNRTWNAFATVMLVSFLVGLGLAFVTGDPRFLLLKDSVLTGTIGICFLVSIAVGRPLTLAAAQGWGEGRSGPLVADYDTDPLVRRGHQVCSLAWGFRAAGRSADQGTVDLPAAGQGHGRPVHSNHGDGDQPAGRLHPRVRPPRPAARSWRPSRGEQRVSIRLTTRGLT